MINKLNSFKNNVYLYYPLLFVKMAKLLVQEAESGERSKFEKFLHAKDINGSTSLLISCHQKDYATVELLIKAGANLQDCDKDNDTAIIFASYETLGFIVAPILKEAPSIYAVTNFCKLFMRVY